MKYTLLLLLATTAVSGYSQPWSAFLDSSRAIDWTEAGFEIPYYASDCPTQPRLIAHNPGAAEANTAAIESALHSCNATHNVVDIPAGEYYIAGWTYGPQGKQVVRGSGPMSTIIHLTAEASCGGMAHGICMMSRSPAYNGSDAVMPPRGTQQCFWSAGYSKGATSITLSRCGSPPPANRMIILDQSNDTTDSGGIYICDSSVPNCTYERPGNFDGRRIGGVTHSQQQIVYVTGVTPMGGASYMISLASGVYFNNIRSEQNPGAWWSDIVRGDGLEDLTLDGSQITHGTVAMYDCYECWVKNVRSLNAGRNHLLFFQSARDVVRDSYFYQSQSHHSVSYGVEAAAASGVLIENNIFQQLTLPLMFGQGSGSVVGYNLSIDNMYDADGWAQASYYSHSAGNEMNLWEGNSFYGIWADDAWGSSTNGTYFRNVLNGWQSGKTQPLFPVALRSGNRAFNLAGNVLGQPGVQTQYQAYATSRSSGIGASRANTSIYELGWGDHGGLGVCGSPECDPLVWTTLMRWGNYDTVTAAVRWDSIEASPGAVPFVGANFSRPYFDALKHELPASLYYRSKPSWWPSARPWPPIGPDVSSGNLGVCGGGYPGAQATAPRQCAGGGFLHAWAGHASSIPAQDCYLDVMQGPPDGTGGALNFDARQCYGIEPAAKAKAWPGSIDKNDMK